MFDMNICPPFLGSKQSVYPQAARLRGKYAESVRHSHIGGALISRTTPRFARGHPQACGRYSEIRPRRPATRQCSQ